MVTLVSTVGSKKFPVLPIRLPPVWISAPFCTASWMKPSMAVTRRALASGPMVVSASSPLPTLIFLVAATNFSTN